MSIADESLGNDNLTDSSSPSPCTETSSNSTVKSGRENATLFPEAFHARILVPQGAGLASPDQRRVFGSKCSESLLSAGLRMSSPRTARCFELEDSKWSSKGLPTWGLMLNGVCLELGTVVRPIAATECGSLLPTPTCAGNEGSPSMQKWAGHRNLQQMLATPTASGSDTRNTNRPSARATKEAGGGQFLALREWMMGYPIGYTGLAPLETGKLASVQQWLGIFLGHKEEQ